jgi:N-(5-amino-5-carboxypentanoyl)-L-cysteinyl-D-valine synthase
MFEPPLSSRAKHWQLLIESTASERCDLDVLLKDEWRHKVVVRDDPCTVGPIEEQLLVIDGRIYAGLKDLLLKNNRISLGAIGLTVFHIVLGTYGDGCRTVVAYAEVDAKGRRTGKILPTIIDHAKQSGRTCIEAVEEIERALQQECAYTAPAELLHRALFDAALLLADEKGALPDITPFPFAAALRDNQPWERMEWTMAYAADLFEDKVIAGLLDVVREVLDQVVFRTTCPVCNLEFVSQEQKRQLEAWNDTEGDFADRVRLNDLFENATRRTPEFEAVVCGSSRLSYRELNARCNQLANWVRGSKGYVSGELIALYLDKSYIVIIATLGIWKAGAAYVPIDPNYPAERVLFTLRDTEATRIMTNRHHVSRLRDLLSSHQLAIQIMEVEDLFEGEAATNLSGENPQLALGSEEVAYVTYTSGTTGVPKAVAKSHRNVVNSITDLSEKYDMLRSGEEKVALLSSLVFEPFMRQTLIALINSQTLVVVPDEVRLDPNRFPAFVEQHGITYLNGTGSVLQHFDLRQCTSLKKMLLVGEELTASGLRQLREKFSASIINEYSFTETAFVTAIKTFAPGVVERPNRSIGRPLRNVKCYVLTKDLKQVPIGSIGELYIGGLGIARGYLNRDRLTAERFLANPFQTEKEKLRRYNEFIYKTGDLARMLPNGEIEFMGRGDFQLKLNGIRVEPGEIEARTTEYPGVRQCVVVARGDPGDWHLIGYFVADASCKVSEADLLEFLEARLIRVMVPARMIRLPFIPVNVNGKVDRRSLPEVGIRGSLLFGERADDASVATVGSDALFDALREIWSTVLGIPAASLDTRADFFRLGGQSITCIRLLMRIWQRLRLVVAVEDMFRLKTLGNLADYLAQQAGAPQPRQPSIEPKGQLSSQPIRLLANGLQQGLMFHSLKSSPGDDAYVMQSVYRYRCSIRPELLKQAWLHAQRKFPSLRLRFEWAEEALQIIDPVEQPLNWHFVDLSETVDPKAQEVQIRNLQARDRTQPYTLTAGQLFRLYLIKQRDDLFALIFSCHHIILDGWSLSIMHDEVHRVYRRLTQNEPIDLLLDTAYVQAQRYWEAHRGDHVDYWMSQVDRITDRGDFSGLLNEQSRYKIALSSYDRVIEHKTKELSIGADRTAAIKAKCVANGLTLHSVLQFVWHKALYAIGGGRTTVVGTIVSGRNLPIDGIEVSVGLFINTLPLVVDHDDQVTKTVMSAIADIQDAVNKMNSRSIVELGRLESGEMKRRLFDTLLVFENYPRLLGDEEARQVDRLLRFEPDYDSDKLDYPLAVVAREADDGLAISLWYAGELFDDIAIDSLLDSVQALFDQVADDMSQQVTDLEYVSAAAVAKLDRWNQTDASFPENKTLHGLFEEVAAHWPGEVAVVYESARLTYLELNERANQLAHYLLATMDVRSDDLVALVMDKSERMIIAILAVWKAGAAYVPIDPGTPDDRLALMLEDTQARLVVTDESHAARLRQLLGSGLRPVLALERLSLGSQSRSNPVTGVSASDLAYAIYTSGTTGRPKAVLIEHRGVVNLHSSMEKLFSLHRGCANEAILSFSNYVFDHFVEQMTDALLSGQTLVVLNDEMRSDEARLYQYMNSNRVTYLSGTPSVLSCYDFSVVSSLSRIDAIGEDFSFSLFDKIRDYFSGMIINGYGPTEISITSHKRLYGKGERRVNKSIGLPVANTKCYVLNREMKRLPVGGIGELFIGGVGVARGYLNRDDLNAESFLHNPFQTTDERRSGRNRRIYRTGDVVRWLPNGELEYLGRNDFQVKIHGQRVELGEIGAILGTYPGVSRALVIAREHRTAADSAVPHKFLVGFYVGIREFSEQDLKLWMRARLPQTLVPVRILRIDEVPMTTSGKLDIRRLPEIDFLSGNEAEYVPPIGEVETKLCDIWSKVLPAVGTPIGVHDDFFALAGDSLRAIRLVQAVTDIFGRVLNVADVFKYTTIEAQVRRIRTTTAIQEGEDVIPVGLADAHVGPPPISFAQERLLFINEFLGGTPAYNIPFVLEVATCGGLSATTITDALRKLLRRHPALRTLLKGERGGVRLQCVLDEDEASVMFDIAEYVVRSKAELDKMLVRESEYVFHLDKELPVRAALFELAEIGDRAYLSIVLHHTCFDGWSWLIFRRELAMLAMGGNEPEIARPRASYEDFALWQRRRLVGDRFVTLTDFWAKALAGFEPLNLPLDRPRPAQFDYRGREIRFDIDFRTASQLKALAEAAKVSFYSVLLGAYCLMLKIFTGQADIVVGTPSANRGRPEFADVIGFFANLLVLRVQVDKQSTLLNYIRSIGEVVLQAQIHEELPFEQLVKTLRVTTDPSRHPIVQAVFSVLNDDDPAQDTSCSAKRMPISNYVPYSGGWTNTKFDLSATISNAANGLTGNFTYAASLFDPASVSHFVATFRHVLTEFARLASAAETVSVSDVTCIDEGNRVELLAAAAGVADRRLTSDCAGRTLHGLFEEVTARLPGEVAVVCESTQLTYWELNERANQLAHFLIATVDLRSNDLVALVMDKSERMIIAILAVWKAGAAYVPIDPGTLDDRVAFMLADTQARLVIADETHTTRLRQLPGIGLRAVLGLERLALASQSRSNPATGVSGGDLAYAIYTSGTTGRPKAVLIEHRNVVSFRNDIAERYFADSESPRQAVLFLANYVFDFSIEQLVLSILSGHKLIVPPKLAFLDGDFYDYANRHELTYLSGTPTQVLQCDFSRLEYLRLVVVAGEAFQRHHFDKIRREYSGPLLNAYGTTETTVYNTVRRFEMGEAFRNALGQPLSNTQLYVLGNEMQLLPTGAVGELFIGGDCISAGYLNQTELTRERFVANPFQAEVERREKPRAVIYKTGDMVRRRVDGELEFLGRNDSQVKINGLRIELGEIEAALSSYPGIRDCVVVVREDRWSPNTRRLFGYYVTEDAATIDKCQLFAFLRAKLMPSMVPALLVRVEGQLPITINGKLDVEALPIADFSKERLTYVAPRNRLESRLCRIWAEFLAGSEVGIDDDFFLCGGDSIMALQLASQVQREFDRKVSVKAIFDFPTVRNFAENMFNGTPDSRGEPGPITGYCPMLPIQEWFFAKPMASREHWNQYFAILTPPLDVNKLHEALNKLVDHHDAFRLRFRHRRDSGDGRFEQFYAENQPEPSLHSLDVRGLSQEELFGRLQEWQSGFDLELGPVHSAAYLYGFDDGTARIWLALHHLIVDVVSWRILLRDLEILYHGGDLGPRGSSYRQWVGAVRTYAPSEDEVQIWAEVADSVAAEAGRKRLVAMIAGSYHERFALSEQDTQKLLIESNRAYNTQTTDLLLTAVAFALRELTEQATNYVTVENHGRQEFEGAPDVRDTVGWFTTMHPLVVQTSEDLGHAIILNMASRKRVPTNGIGYGAVRGTYGSTRAPLPVVCFNYLGHFVGGTSSNVKRFTAVEPARWYLDFALCGTSRAANEEDAKDCLVDLTMSCVQGRMVVELDSRLGRLNTKRFTAELKTRLEEVISHTSRVAVRRKDWVSGRGDFDPYILANDGEGGPLLFILPPSEGGAESYLNNLARQLRGVRLVLFNNVHLHRPMPSFDALARYYLAHVRRLQPTGPYNLLGWSFGGVLSLEMAVQLTQVGETISNLFFIDSFFNVKKASAEIGLPGVDTILDPINYHYEPNEADLERLHVRTKNSLLFKATKPSETFRGERQRRLFEYYARSSSNNLDSLLPIPSFAVELLAGETHFSWVRNGRLVATIGLRIRTLVRELANA